MQRFVLRIQAMLHSFDLRYRSHMTLFESARSENINVIFIEQHEIQLHG